LYVFEGFPTRAGAGGRSRAGEPIYKIGRARSPARTPHSARSCGAGSMGSPSARPRRSALRAGGAVSWS